MEPKDWIDLAAAIGTDVGAFVAVAAALYAVKQVRLGQQLNAQDAYLEFNRIGIEHPRLAEPTLVNMDNPIEASRYGWYVLSMLMCDERILLLFPRDKEWIRAVKGDLTTHRHYLKSEALNASLDNYSTALRGLISEVLIEHYG